MGCVSREWRCEFIECVSGPSDVSLVGRGKDTVYHLNKSLSDGSFTQRSDSLEYRASKDGCFQANFQQ